MNVYTWHVCTSSVLTNNTCHTFKISDTDFKNAIMVKGYACHEPIIFSNDREIYVHCIGRLLESFLPVCMFVRGVNSVHVSMSSALENHRLSSTLSVSYLIVCILKFWKWVKFSKTYRFCHRQPIKKWAPSMLSE
jgi:hypothetical protein